MIQILHYVDSTSDKIWAINTNPLAGGNYEVFYGRRTNKLTRCEVDIKNPHTRISEQERRGYERVIGQIDIQSDGTLTNRRLFADVSPHFPDGICLDTEGAIWVADPVGGECIRVLEGGKITDRVDTGRGCFACMLGGANRNTLFMMTADDFRAETVVRAQNGKVEYVEVDVPGAGWP